MLFAFDRSSTPTQLATVTDDGALIVWNVQDGSIIQKHTRPAQLAVKWTCIAWSAPMQAGSIVALGSDSGVVVVWDMRQGRIIAHLNAHTHRVTDVVFEEGGQTLLTCAEDRLVVCWDLKTYTPLSTQSMGQACVQRILPTASGEYILLANTTIRLCRRDTWKQVGKVPGHASRIACLCRSPDDRLMATCANDRHLTLWRLSISAEYDTSDACIQTLALDTSIVQLAFSNQPNENSGVSHYSLLALDAAGRARIWRFDSSVLVSSTKQKKKKRMSVQGGATGTSSVQPPLPEQPSCVIEVGNASEEHGVESDPQRIFHAAFSGVSDVVVAYGSSVKPTITTCQVLDSKGDVQPHICLHRIEGGIFSQATRAVESRSSKRSREASTIGAADIALPAMAKRHGEATDIGVRTVESSSYAEATDDSGTGLRSADKRGDLVGSEALHTSSPADKEVSSDVGGE